jgi:hypothetical protein
MKSRDDLDSRSIEDLWALHQMVLAELSRRILAERNALDMRLRQLGNRPGTELRLRQCHRQRHLREIAIATSRNREGQYEVRATVARRLLRPAQDHRWGQS